MTDDFDPYYTWLGIPPEEQPADHYRLLGVRRFEPSLDVISNAGDQRMAFLRTFQVGKRSALSQRLLNEMAAAKVCLLDPDRRQAYDDKLKASQPKPVAPQVAAQPAPVYSPPSPVLVPSRQAPVARPMPAAPRLPSTSPDPFSELDPFADAARQIHSQPALPAKPPAESSGDYSDQLMALVRTAVSRAQESPIATAAYGVLALGVVMVMSVVVWVTFRGEKVPAAVAAKPSPVTAGKVLRTPANSAKQASPAALPAAVPSQPASAATPPTVTPEKPLPTRVAPAPAVTADSPEPSPLAAGSAALVDAGPGAKGTPLPAAAPATTVPEPSGTMTAAQALERLRALGVQGLATRPEDVTAISIHNIKFGDADAPCLATLPRLTHLYFTEVPVTGKTLQALQECRKLEVLTLHKADIGDDDLTALGKVTTLTQLSMPETRVTAKGLEHLKNLSNLTSLTLPQGAGRELIPYLAKFSKLRHLYPFPPGVTDEDMQVIGQLRSLENLDLQQSKLTAEGYKELANLTEVKIASISNAAPAGVMVHFAKMKLNYLGFPSSSTEKELELFQKMGTVRNLRPPRDTSDEGLRVVANYPGLEDVALAEAKNITDAGLVHLAKMQALKHLHLPKQIGDQGFINLSRSASLRSIDIDASAVITQRGVEAIATLPELERIGLPASVDDSALRALAKCPKLKSVMLYRSKVTENGLKSLQELAKLEEINLIDIKLTTPAMEAIKSLTGLTSLMLQECSVSPAEAESLKAAFPKARVYISR
jgi:Leucine-rich repeat (LRR) protein